MKLNKQYVRSYFKSRTHVIVFIIVVALVIFRLFLPLIVKNYVNKSLNRIPGYHGFVEDIGISLWRGAYVINGLHLFKDGNKQPMLDLPVTDISIEWSSLFHGRIVSKVKMYRPKFNLYVTANKLSSKQTPDKDDWTKALKDLVPIKINRFTVEDGEFLYADILESPDINLSIKQISLTATNLGNVVDRSNILPSDVTVHAVSFGNGNLDVTANMNLLKEIPDMDVNVSLKNSNATALNTVTLATAGFDFEKGKFELYSEFAISNGYLKGYFKPMFTNIKIPDSLGKPNSNILKRLWEGVITFVGFVLKNKPHDSFATKIPIEGDLNDPNIKLWTMITNIFRNAFIKPFKSQVDNDIKLSDAHPHSKKK
jgi:Domain of Unknown Function (DUF748)